MNSRKRPTFRRIAMSVVIAVALSIPIVSTADARDHYSEVEQIAFVSGGAAKAKPKCATGTLTPSGTHCYLPAAVTPR